MYIKNSYITFTYRIIFLIVCGLSIVTQFSLTDMFHNSKMLAYFTIESAIFCFLVFIILARSTYREIKHKNIPFFRYSYCSLKGMATLAILITFLCYQVLLKNTGFSMYFYKDAFSLMKDLLSHYIVPIMVVLDWLLFQPKGLYRWFDTLTWIIFPLIYFIVIIVRGLYSKEYPYFFLNIQEIGIAQVLIFACIFISMILLIGFAFFFLDKGLALLYKNN